MHSKNKPCTFYVTTPIYYVNAKPHLGTFYTTLLADVTARWNKIKGCDTFFLTGTDEHGQKVAEAAAVAGKTPQAHVDELAEIFKQVWQRYNLNYTRFIRTTDNYHVKAVQKWLTELIAKGEIYKSTYEGWYCPSNEAFLTEKDLEFKEAGQPPISLLSGKPARWVSEECYFFRLSAYQDRLLEFYRTHPDFITPAERLNEVIAFVENGLKDLSISRKTITWGIPFPGDESHVTYVWADALANYLTAVGFEDETRTAEFSKWWPADVQIMAKDIVRFHAIYWPAFLMASGLELPKRLVVHGWIRVNGEKMSKSLGNVIDPVEIADQYGIDPIRYYLTRYIAITQDSSISTDDIEQRINTDLANDFGNLINRTITLALKNGLSSLPTTVSTYPADKELHAELQRTLIEFETEMNRYFFHQAYAALWKYVASINRYFHAQEPWKVIKQNPERFNEIITTTCQAITAVGVLLWPVMPQTIEKLFKAVGFKFVENTNYLEMLKAGSLETPFTLSALEPLFTKYDKKETEPMTTPTQTATDKTTPEKTAPAQAPTAPQGTQGYISIDQFAQVELVVGTILEAEGLPQAEKILVMKVNCGSYGIRTICAGVKKYYTPEELKGTKTVFVLNLQPRALFGIVSQGMMLTATNADGKPTPVRIDATVPEGTRLK
ncbi:TPA: methionine--tRNA ligase [Candidatus Dependentiae bacterium]|nr:MAG: Methionyl-tRNA synthetase [candidate division TM6 bacterium GW2011_GWF2_43_87]HBL98558.1 methionine--tRNA ligase [Candidatus Dependentiae bacterium]